MAMRNYPRSCGEEVATSLAVAVTAELPPLVRGRAVTAEELTRLDGITPARAGKSLRP